MNIRVLIGLVALLLGTTNVLAVDILKIKSVGGSLEPGKNGEPLKYYHEYIIENTADYAVPLDDEPFELPEYVASISKVTFCGEVLSDVQYEYNRTTHSLKLIGVSINPHTTCTLSIEAFTVPPLYSTVAMRPAGGNTYELIISLSPYTSRIDKVIPIVIPKNSLTCNISIVQKVYPQNAEAWDVEFYEGKEYYYIIIDRKSTTSGYYILRIVSSEGVCVYKNERIYLHQFSRVAGYDLGREEIMGYEVSKEVGDLLAATYAIPKPFTSPFRYSTTTMDYSGDTGKYIYRSVVEPSVYFEKDFSGEFSTKCTVKVDRTGMIHTFTLEKNENGKNITNCTKSGTIYNGTWIIEKDKSINVSLVDKNKAGVYDTLCFDIDGDGNFIEEECIVSIKSKESYSSISDEYVLNDIEGIDLPEEFIYRTLYYEMKEDKSKVTIYYTKVPTSISESTDRTWKGVAVRVICTPTIQKNGIRYENVFLSLEDFRTLLLVKPDPNTKYYVANKIHPGELFRVKEAGNLYMLYDVEKSYINKDAESPKEGDKIGHVYFAYYHEAKDKVRYRILAVIPNAYVPPSTKDDKWGVRHTVFVGYDGKKVVLLDYNITGDYLELLNTDEARILIHGLHGRISEETNRVFFVYIKYIPGTDGGRGKYVYVETQPQYVLARVDISMVIDKTKTYKYYKYAIDQAMYMIYKKILEASDGPALYTEKLPFNPDAQIVDYNSSDNTYVKVLKNEKEGYVLIAQLVDIGEPKEVKLLVKVPSSFYIRATSSKSCTSLGNEELCEESYTIYNGESESIELRFYRQRDRGEIVSSVYYDNVAMYDYKVEYGYDSAGQPIYILYLNITPGVHSLKVITKKLPEVVSPEVTTEVIIEDNTVIVQTKAKVVNLYSEILPASRVFIPTPCTPTKVYYVTPAGLQEITEEKFVLIKTNGVELTLDLYPGKEYEYVIVCTTDKISVTQLSDDTVSDEHKIYTDEKKIQSSLDSAVQLDITFKAPTLYPSSVKYYTVYLKKNDTYFKLPENISVQLTVEGIIVRGLVLDKGESIIIGAKWSYVTPITLKTDKEKFIDENYEASLKYVESVRKNYTYSKLPERIRKTLDSLEQIKAKIDKIMSKDLLYYNESFILQDLTSKYVKITQNLKELINTYLEDLRKKEEVYKQLLEEIEKLNPLISMIKDIINQKKQQAALEEDIQVLKEFEDKLIKYEQELEDMKNIEIESVALNYIQSLIQKVNQIRSDLEVLQSQVTQYQVTPKEILDQAAVLVSQIEQLIKTFVEKIQALKRELDTITHPDLLKTKQSIEESLNTLEVRIGDLERLKAQAKEIKSQEDLDIVQQHLAEIQNEIDTQLSTIEKQIDRLKTRQQMLIKKEQTPPTKPLTNETKVEEEEKEERELPLFLLGLIGLLGAFGVLFILAYLGKIRVPVLSDFIEKFKKRKEISEEEPTKEQSKEGGETPAETVEETSLGEEPTPLKTKEQKELSEEKGTEVAPGVKISEIPQVKEQKKSPEEEVEELVQTTIEELKKVAKEETTEKEEK